MRVRPSVDAMPAYAAGAKAPGATVLASNETPFGLLPAVREAMLSSLESASLYPDPNATAMREAIAARHDLDPASLAVGCGSVELCGQLTRALVDPGDEVVYAWRSFEAYPIVTALASGVARPVPLVDHTHDLEALAAAVTPRTQLLLVCNPNNPTGTAVGAAAIEKLLDTVPGNILVVLDEAYIEYTDATVPDGLTYARERSNVAVLRTFSKAYAMAGLRVGWCYGPPHIAAALRKVQTPFSVSPLGQVAAVAALGEDDEVARRAKLVVRERERVTTELRALGYVVPPSQANFVWIQLDDGTDDFTARCRAGNVLIRPFSGDGVRVTTGLPEQNDRFLGIAAAEAATFAKVR